MFVSKLRPIIKTLVVSDVNCRKILEEENVGDPNSPPCVLFLGERLTLIASARLLDPDCEKSPFIQLKK